MKIAVLTLPVYTNYGGILQACALCETLSGMGHDVTLINRQAKFYDTFPDKVHIFLKNFIRGLKGEDKKVYLDSCIYARRTENLKSFFDARLHLGRKIHTTEALKAELENGGYDVLVIGSDQVWRPVYAPVLEEFFGAVCPENLSLVSYAASFGVDEWEYSPEQTARCGKMLERFRAVSVRESSGVELCREYFGIDAVQMPDPTLLFDSGYYMSMSKGISAQKGIFAYILDKNEKTERAMEFLASLSSMELHLMRGNEECPAAVGEWIANIANADFVLTDSFHGCVFSIVFNKPFIAVGNEKRGQSRFSSLLNLFGLEHRMVRSVSEINETLLLEKIDWLSVNMKRNELKNRALDYLKNALDK